MKKFQLILLLLAVVIPASAQDWIVSLRGPATLQRGEQKVNLPDGFQAHVLRRKGTVLTVRPLVYIHQDFVAEDGLITGNNVNLRAGPYGRAENAVVGSISKGAKLVRLDQQGEWVYGYWEKLATYQVDQGVHIPGTIGSTTEPPGLSSALLTQLRELRTPQWRSPSLVLLPTKIPAGYTGTLTDLENGDRWGISYRIRYQKGDSHFDLAYATAGIGDRWLEKPAKLVEVRHHALGSWTVAKLVSPGRERWATQWMPVPGRKTKDWHRYQGGFLGLDFSPDFSEKQVLEIVGGLANLQRP